MPATGLLVFGGGRMGRLVAETAATKGLEVKVVVARHRPDWLEERTPWAPGLEALPSGIEVAVDFSLPDGTTALAPWCAAHGVALVSGTTGLGESQRGVLDLAAQSVPVLWAANFSVGLNACLVLAKRLRELVGPEPAAHILDVHHVHKKDAPSGTALVLGEAIGGAVHYDSVREGEVIGEHHLVLDLGDERIELRHQATDRRLFAGGALVAARWLVEQSAGRYSMPDCISSAR
jgi:4-hydroxy-tetrahydrodipicolinate reductase